MSKADANGYSALLSSGGAVADSLVDSTTQQAQNFQWVGGNKASFTISDSGNIVADKTVTVQKGSGSAVTFTAKASAASGAQFNTDASASTTATNLAAAINAHSDFTASATGSVVTVAATGGAATTITTTDAAKMAISGSLSNQGDLFTIGTLIILLVNLLLLRVQAMNPIPSF